MQSQELGSVLLSAWISLLWLALPGSQGHLAQGQLSRLWRNHTWLSWWNLSSESFFWQRADLGKGKSQRDAGVKDRWVMDKEQITFDGGPTLGNTEMEKNSVWGKVALIFGQDHLTHKKKICKGLFLLPAISQVPTTCAIKEQKALPGKLWKRKLSKRNYQLLKFDEDKKKLKPKGTL